MKLFVDDDESFSYRQIAELRDFEKLNSSHFSIFLWLFSLLASISVIIFIIIMHSSLTWVWLKSNNSYFFLVCGITNTRQNPQKKAERMTLFNCCFSGVERISLR